MATTSGLDLDEEEDEDEAFLDTSFLGPFFLPPFFFPPFPWAAEPEEERRTFSDSGSSPVESALAVRTCDARELHELEPICIAFLVAL